MLQALANFIGVGHRLGITGQDQAHAHQRLTQLCQQCQSDAVVRNPQADGATLLVQQQPRHLTGAVEDERVGARYVGLEQTEGARVDLGV
ncbi:hypothetical protein D3C79_860740 [compost metagenome]